MSENKKSDVDRNSSELKKRLKELENKVEKPTQITRIKRLEKLQDKLEGMHKLNRLKRLEKIALIPQTIIFIFLFFLGIYLNGGSLEPLYIPIYHSLIILGVWTIILSIEFLIFRLLEIRYGKSKSSNFLLAKRSIKKAYQFAVIFLLIFTFFFIPIFTNQISGFVSIEEEIDLEKSEAKTVNFTTRDILSFLVTKNIKIEILPYGQRDSLKNATVNVRLYEKSNYEGGRKNLTINSEENDPDHASLDNDFRYRFSGRDFEENVLYMESNQNLTVKYQIEKTLPKERNFYSSIISFTIGIVFIGWIFLLNTVKKEETKESIYH